MFDRDFAVFMGLVVLAAAWAVVQLSLMLRGVVHKELAWPLRLAALLPPLTPVVGFRAGARVRVVLWVLFAGGYLVLRTAA